MKSLTKSTKDQKIIILNGANEEDIFKKWLDVIGMLEEDFLKFSETDGFEIRKKLLETDHNFYEISMLFKKNNVEEKIGYSFLVKADDAKELGIVVRILLCISEKLDAACKKETLHYYELDFEGYERSDDNDAYALCLKTDIKDLTEADGLVITGITQDVEGLLASPNARKMISNSGHIIMLNQSDSNLEELATMLHLSDSQRNYVTMSEEGCGLLFAEKVIVPFNDSFPKDSYLYKLMSTKFGENFNIEEGDGKLTNEDATELRKRFKLDELKQKQLQRKEKDNVAEKEQREEKTDIINDVDENIKVENKTIHQDIQQLFKTMDGNGELLQPEGVYYGINPSSKNLILSKELEQSTHREETTLDFEKNSGLSKEDRGNEMQDSHGVHETEEDGGKQNKVDEILQDMPDDMRSILLDRLLKNEK